MREPVDSRFPRGVMNQAALENGRASVTIELTLVPHRCIAEFQREKALDQRHI